MWTGHRYLMVIEKWLAQGSVDGLWHNLVLYHFRTALFQHETRSGLSVQLGSVACPHQNCTIMFVIFHLFVVSFIREIEEWMGRELNPSFAQRQSLQGDCTITEKLALPLPIKLLGKSLIFSDNEHSQLPHLASTRSKCAYWKTQEDKWGHLSNIRFRYREQWTPCILICLYSGVNVEQKHDMPFNTDICQLFVG